MLPVAALLALLTAAEPQGRTGLSFQGDVLLPLQGYGDPTIIGYGAAIGWWTEWAHAALQPQLAFHYGPGQDGARFIDTSASIGALILPLDGPITPFIGGGVALRWFSLRGLTTTTEVGSLIRTRVEETPSFTEFGPGLYGRAGALFFRDSTVELIVSGDYSATFVTGTPQTLVFSIGLST
jgi:hypothetical protein